MALDLRVFGRPLLESSACLFLFRYREFLVQVKLMHVLLEEEVYPLQLQCSSTKIRRVMKSLQSIPYSTLRET